MSWRQRTAIIAAHTSCSSNPERVSVRSRAHAGAGGMGAVYRARDLKLNRDVAIKVLPEAFACDPDRVARFTREAQALAALNHPHIAHVYGLEDLPPNCALIMEFVEGQTLERAWWTAARCRAPRPSRSWMELPTDLPDGMRRLIARCLVKDPQQRLRDICEARIALEDPATVMPRAAAVAQSPLSGGRRGLWSRAAFPLAAAGALLMAALTIVALLRPRAAPAPLMTFDIDVPAGSRLRLAERPALEISPDGNLIAFAVVADSARAATNSRTDYFLVKDLAPGGIVNGEGDHEIHVIHVHGIAWNSIRVSTPISIAIYQHGTRTPSIEFLQPDIGSLDASA
jgi:Protein kinase domain